MPDPIDAHLGARLCLRRRLRGLSQTDLATAMGVTYQQVQKYERGANRMAAATLYRAAEALDVPIGFFFDGLPRTAGHRRRFPVTAIRSAPFVCCASMTPCSPDCVATSSI